MKYKEINGLRFREPKGIEYEKYITYLQQNDMYSANEIIIKNTIHKEDVKKINDDNIIDYFNNVYEICDFCQNINLKDTYVGKEHKEEYDKLKAEHEAVISITLDKKAAFFKMLDRQQLRNAYNLLNDSMFQAWKYITSECFLGGDTELITNDKYFASSVFAAKTFVLNRNEMLKKK